MSIDRGIGGLDALYREVILDHHRSPRNFGVLAPCHIKHEGFNPLCGDRIEVLLRIHEGKLSACHFMGEGCSICMASASMMTEELTGKTVVVVRAFIDAFRKLLRGEQCPLSIEGDLESLVGVRQFPVRIKCALLPWTTLNEALDLLEKQQNEAKAPSKEELMEWIAPIEDPDVGVSLVGLGLIYEVRILPREAGGFKAEVDMTLTTPMCPSAGYLQTQVEKRLLEHAAIKEASIKLVFEPKWDPHTMASDEVKDRLGIW